VGGDGRRIQRRARPHNQLLSRFENNVVNETSENQRTVWVIDLGPIAYSSACDLQRELVQARKAGILPDVLLICEHPHVNHAWAQREAGTSARWK